MPSRLRVGVFDRAGYVHSIGAKRIRKVFGYPYPIKPRFKGDLEKFFRGWYVVFWRERRGSRGKTYWFKELSKRVRTLEAQREAAKAQKVKAPKIEELWWAPPDVPPVAHPRRRQVPQAQAQQIGVGARVEEQQRVVDAYNELLMQQARAQAVPEWRPIEERPAPQEPEPAPIRWFGEEPEGNDEER